MLKLLKNHLGLFFSLLTLLTLQWFMVRESGAGMAYDHLLAFANLSLSYWLVLLFWFIYRFFAIKPRAWFFPLLIQATFTALLYSSQALFLNLDSMQYLLFYALTSLPWLLCAALIGTTISRLFVYQSIPFKTVIFSGLIIYFVAPIPQPNSNTDPSATVPLGELSVDNYQYGSGTIQRQSLYETPYWKSKTIDLAQYIAPHLSKNTKARDQFWQFDLARFPLNAEVWLPKTSQPQPLVIISHGDFFMEKYSEHGYAYLGQHLASLGYAVVSIDANALNWSADGNYWRQEDLARAQLILAHIKQIKAFSEQSEHPLANVDLNQIALIGHSRGGDAIMLAAKLNLEGPQFNLKTLIGLAPVDSIGLPNHESPIALNNINYLVLQGGVDTELPYFQGQNHYDNVHISAPGLHKLSIFATRADHSQFNQDWSDAAKKSYLRPLYNTANTMPDYEQRKWAKLAVTHFLNLTLRDKSIWPKISTTAFWQQQFAAETFITQRADSSHVKLNRWPKIKPKITDAKARIRPISQQGMPEIQQQEALSIHWNGQAKVDFSLPYKLDLRYMQLNLTTLCIAQAQNTSLTVVLIDSSGKQSSQAIDNALCRALPAQHFNSQLLNAAIQTLAEPKQQQHIIPLGAFFKNSEIAPLKVTKIRIEADASLPSDLTIVSASLSVED
ncbi:MAG: hypothetical protein HN790_13020 [Methylococcales bacterium]|nr:hypothetical protein [Methylococcales bacterium]